MLPSSFAPHVLAASSAQEAQVTESSGCKAGQVPMDRAPGRIGFMSTQRRASRKRGINHPKRDAIVEQKGSSFGTRFGSATASGATAPFMSILWLAWAWLLGSGADASRGAQDRVATNSLLSDHRFRALAQRDHRRSSPPLRAAGRSGESAATAKHRLSSLHIPQFPARARLHSTLPHAPAGENRWAERYDGKGNLHIQHAA